MTEQVVLSDQTHLLAAYQDQNLWEYPYAASIADDAEALRTHLLALSYELRRRFGTDCPPAPSEPIAEGSEGRAA